MILTPQEENKFKNSTTKIQTPYGILTALKKSESGNCIFYNAKKNYCEQYKNRPFECRAYPLLIHFDEQITFKLDSMLCHKTDKLSPEEIEKMKQDWLRQSLPLSWIKAYSTI